MIIIVVSFSQGQFRFLEHKFRIGLFCLGKGMHINECSGVIIALLIGIKSTHLIVKEKIVYLQENENLH